MVAHSRGRSSKLAGHLRGRTPKKLLPRYLVVLLAREPPRFHSEILGPVELLSPQRLYCTARDRKSTRLNSSHGYISYAVFCLKKKNNFNLNLSSFFFFNDTATTEIYTLSLHDALPISEFQAGGSLAGKDSKEASSTISSSSSCPGTSPVSLRDLGTC